MVRLRRELSRRLVEPLIVFGQFFQLGVTKNRPIFTDIEMADVTPATFSDATFHSLFKGGINPFVWKSKGHQFWKGEFDHDGRPTDHRACIF